jgi:hypothetical protein
VENHRSDTSLTSRYDEFLFASICEEANGMRLSVVSALASSATAAAATAAAATAAAAAAAAPKRRRRLDRSCKNRSCKNRQTAGILLDDVSGPCDGDVASLAATRRKDGRGESSVNVQRNLANDERRIDRHASWFSAEASLVDQI